MNELSRMERHRSRNKGRKNKAVTAPAAPKSGMPPKAVEERSELRRSKAPAGTRNSSGSGGDGLSRSRRTASAPADLLEEAPAPRRTNTYSSYRVRVSKWFVNSLIVIFILLMASLLWWGLIGAPPLSELIKELL